MTIPGRLGVGRDDRVTGPAKVFKTSEAARARSRRYYAAHRDESRERARQYRLAGYQRPPGGNLNSNYGITHADYSWLVITQCGACAICGTVPSADPDAHKKVSKLMVDHDHETGQVRGLLCSHCNLMLGQSGENSERLLVGAGYLREWEAGLMTTPAKLMVGGDGKVRGPVFGRTERT